MVEARMKRKLLGVKEELLEKWPDTDLNHLVHNEVYWACRRAQTPDQPLCSLITLEEQLLVLDQALENAHE